MKLIRGFRFQWPVLLLLCCLFGCTTDFSTITPYKETMVIYGMLNPNDSVQYIRVSKAYLGEGDALVMAKQPDSIYYGNILDVKLERNVNDLPTNTYVFSKTPLDSVPKEAGTFVAPDQAVYAGRINLADANNAGGVSYKITVKNKQSGVTATATTLVIGNFTVPAYYLGTQNFEASPDLSYYSLIPTDLGKFYNMTMRLSFTDTNKVSHFLFDWNLGDQTSEVGNISELPFYYHRSYLFTLDSIAAQNFPRGPHKEYTFKLELFVTGGTNDLYTYSQASNPSNSIVQDRPLITNIQNGVGLFTCRNLRVGTLKLSLNTNTRLDSYFQ